MTRFLAAAIFAATLGAQGAFAADVSESQQPAGTSSALTAEQDEAAIRCLLPPRMTRLARSTTTLAPGRIIETALADCLIRGGSRLDPSA